MKATTTWVLIADGARARIVRYVEDEARTEDLVFEIDHRQLREIMSDKPGRSFASADRRRSAMEYRSDPVQEQEARFAATLIEELERRFEANEFERLAIVAEHRLLGVLRKKLPPALRQAIVAEVAKDLTKLPRRDLLAAIVELGIVQ